MRIWNAPVAVSRKVHGWLMGATSLIKGDPSSDGGWLEPLQRAGRDLETLAKSTEGEFLSIGEQLQHFHQRAGEISKISQSVAHLMSGQEVAGVIEGFHDVIHRMKRLEGESELSLEGLQSVLEILTKLQGQLGGFHKTVRSLRMLCVSIKIESARQGDNDVGFQDLAGEVGKLALEVEDRCSHLFGRSEALSELIAEALNRVRSLLTSQHAQAGVILERTASSLESITERHSLSSAGAENISERYDAISRRIGEIVTSMQFHDITRQRMEHAKEALDRVLDDHRVGGHGGRHDGTQNTEAKGGNAGCHARKVLLGNNGRENSSGEAAEFQRTAVSICKLQMAQLRHADKELVSAVEDIIDNLSGVASLVENITQETQKMAGAADKTGRSSLVEVESAFSSVMASLSTYADAKRELSVVIGSAGQTLGDMSSYIGDVEGIGTRIKLIALNAIVKASHMGTEGATLSLLAEAIHQLSADTCRQTEMVSQSLASITSASEVLCEGLGSDGRDEGAEIASIDETLKDLLNTLTSINQDTFSMLTRMNEEGRTLSNRLLTSAGTMSVHHRVDQVVCQVVSQLEEIVELSGVQGSTESQLEREERLRAIEASYTMQGERDVHQSILGAGAAVTDSSLDPTNIEAAHETKNEQVEGKSDEESEEDLGDNIEFF
jgi:hypothetical protein